jgi:ABC-type cobalamin transport system ATPase subunit
MFSRILNITIRHVDDVLLPTRGHILKMGGLRV